MNETQRETTRLAFALFLQSRVKSLRSLRLKQLEFNPFLLRLYSGQNALGLSTARDIIEWRLAQRMERGAVTSLGDAFQKVAIGFADRTGVEGSDLVKIKRAGTRSQTYYLQLKSGPNTVPKDLAVITRQLLERAQAFNRGSVPIYAMAYGSRAQISNVVRRYVEARGVQVSAGREFWEFISDDPKCMEEIYEIAAGVARDFEDTKGQSLKDVLEETSTRLAIEFELEYGTEASAWGGLLERNS